MRVTFGSIFRNGLIDINRTTEELAIRQREVSSVRRIHLPGDDPADMAAAMPERSEMAALDQFTQTTDSVDLFSGGQSLTPPYSAGPPLSGYQGDASVQSGNVARDRAVQAGDMAGSDQGIVDVGQAFDRVTSAQTQIGIELTPLPEDARLAESIGATTPGDAAHRAALGALANAGRLSPMDYPK
jgi:flagellin-like hook-associated protein FlgL